MSEPEIAYVGGLPCECEVAYSPRHTRYIDALDAHVQSCDQPWKLTAMNMEPKP